MKRWITVGLIMMVAVACHGGNVFDKKVIYTTERTVETNKVSESTYNTRTNGYTWIVNERPFPSADYGYLTLGCTTGSVMYIGYNTTCVNAPDPFEEKITVKYYTVISAVVYTMHIGPLDIKCVTENTVLRRWKTVHKQKINMTESTETVKE